MNARAVKFLAATKFLPLLLLLVQPAAVQAQFNYVITNATLTITKYTGPGGMVNIPDTYFGWPVTSIGDYAFSGNSTVTSVTIPNSVTTMGNYTFYACINLTSVTIGDSVNSMGNYSFTSCSNLTSVTISNGVTTFGYYTFAECTSLASITIPSSVTNLGFFGFLTCTKLTGVYFQGNALSADTSVFINDTNAIAYYVAGTKGWGAKFDGIPTWNPLVQTSDNSFGVHTNQFGFTITGNSNLVVVVESCTDISNPNWQPVQTTTLTGGSSYFSDPQWTNYPERFYRLRSP